MSSPQIHLHTFVSYSHAFCVCIIKPNKIFSGLRAGSHLPHNFTDSYKYMLKSSILRIRLRLWCENLEEGTLSTKTPNRIFYTIIKHKLWALWYYSHRSIPVICTGLLLLAYISNSENLVVLSSLEPWFSTALLERSGHVQFTPEMLSETARGELRRSGNTKDCKSFNLIKHLFQ